MLFWPHSAHHFGTSEPRIQAEMGPSGPHSQARCSHCCFNLTDENFSNPHSLSAQNMKMALLAPLSPSLSHNFDHPSSLRYDPPARAFLGLPGHSWAFLGQSGPIWANLGIPGLQRRLVTATGDSRARLLLQLYTRSPPPFPKVIISL